MARMIGRKVGFGIRKKQILKLLDGVWMTPRLVGAEVGITENAARILMRRCQVSGLLLRKPRPGRPIGTRGRRAYVYTLSRQGRKVLPLTRYVGARGRI